MRWSRLFIPTLRDDPAEAEAASHRLLVRAGFMRQQGAGLWSLLPLGQLVALRIEHILREEMSAIGAQEFLHPSLLPAKLWRESGRWDEVDSIMFRFPDRKRADHCLAFTHEEVFTATARDELRSYRDLPQIWYQIQTKYRDEPRPKSGLLRVREFRMKDSYSFDVDESGLDVAFNLHAEAYRKIFRRAGLEPVEVEASSGPMGGDESVEFQSYADAGEDWTVTCDGCGYAANLEKAESALGDAGDPPECPPPEKFSTPGVRTIEQLAEFEGGAPADRQIKTLVYRAGGDLVLFLLRGDDELNEVKAIDATGAFDLGPAGDDPIRKAMGASAGSLGAVGVANLDVYADPSLRGRRGMTTGANEDDFHLRNVDVERDIPAIQWATLRSVREGEGCVRCGKPLAVRRSIEIGHIFKLGRRYSESMGAMVLGADGEQIPIVMGSYGIGVGRLMAAVVEAHSDANGIIWPRELSPFDVAVVPVKASAEDQMRAAEEVTGALERAGYSVLLDDRDERAGVKFKDADLIGVPFRITIGPRALAKGNVELQERASGKASSEEVPLSDALGELERRLGR